MKTVTHPQSDAVGPRPTLAETRVKESTLRRVAQLSVAVVLIAAGIAAGFYVNPELAATLVTAGIHTGLDAVIRGHDERKHRPPVDCSRPAFGLA